MMKRNKRWRFLEGDKRARKVAKRYYIPNEYTIEGKKIEEYWTKENILRMRSTRVRCSCAMCGHRRYWMGKTYQEKKHDHDIEEIE